MCLEHDSYYRPIRVLPSPLNTVGIKTQAIFVSIVSQEIGV